MGSFWTNVSVMTVLFQGRKILPKSVEESLVGLGRDVHSPPTVVANANLT